MPIIYSVLQKNKTEGHKQYETEEATMVSKKKKGFKCKKDWTDDKISLLIDMLKASVCLWDMSH